jgi:thymidylate synthase
MLSALLMEGDEVHSRNHDTLSIINYPKIEFHRTPLVTLRRTAWKKAIREMEWFLSDSPVCPEELRDWWDGQLDRHYRYLGGYGDQLRRYGANVYWDQIHHLLEGIRTHPNSRRLIATTWHPWEMAHITELNDNPHTPTTCHGTIIQCFVRQSRLSMTVYQRSADVLLGTPHNWIQYWALLLWLSFNTGYEAGALHWMFGDLHLYTHPTHLAVAKAIQGCEIPDIDAPNLTYYSEEPAVFRASDFSMDRDIPAPITELKPKLLV